MTTLREAAQQALEFCEFLWRDVPLNDYSEDMRQDVEAALRAALEQPEQEPELQLDGMTPLQFALEELHAFQEATGCDTASEFRAALEQPAKCDGGTCGLGGYCDECPKRQPEQEPGWRLSCGCPSQYGGIPAEWPEVTREGDPATAYGVICEKHWHEYEARCPNCASLQEQNTEIDRKLAELSERHLTDEVIADLWHQNGGFHHHFARAVERWLKGKDHA
jgi:hypothetical protein